jgi:hypothetical protein
MTAILRAALCVAFAVSSTPTIAPGQVASTESLAPRIDLLERRVADLERRVRELEALIKVGPAPEQPIPDSRKWQDLANWRRLQRGMTMNEVRALLGEPERVEALVWTIWYWNEREAEVRFDIRSGKVDAWSEPRR